MCRRLLTCSIWGCQGWFGEDPGECERRLRMRIGRLTSRFSRTASRYVDSIGGENGTVPPFFFLFFILCFFLFSFLLLLFEDSNPVRHESHICVYADLYTTKKIRKGFGIYSFRVSSSLKNMQGSREFVLELY